MQLTERVWLVGSGQVSLSNPMDCHVYLVGGPEAYFLIDAGVGLETERVVANIAATGVRLADIKGLLITHAHSDHAGGARALSQALSTEVFACAAEARQLAAGTPETLGLTQAKASGVYPTDYQYAHHQATVIADDWQTQSGAWTLRAVVSPGHSIGATAFVLETEGRRDLFPGDIVFWGGRLGLLNCWGSSAEAYREHFPRLARLGITGLFPGHALFCLTDGQRHLDRAAEALEGVYLPESFG